MEQRLQKVEELKRGLKSRQGLLRTARSQSEAAAKASFILAEEIAKSARSLTDRQLFLNVSLSRNTIADRVNLLSVNPKEQLVKKGEDLIAYFLAVHESKDISDVAQLSVFTRAVDSSLTLTEELLA